jgi:hypothetical protein
MQTPIWLQRFLPPAAGTRERKAPTMPIICIGRQKIQSWRSWILVLLLGFGYLESARAGSASDAFADSLDPTSGQNPNLIAGIGDYFADWFKRVDETLAMQPNFMVPVFTVSPLLTELYRYDQYWEHLPNGGGNLKLFGAGKGLFLIPAKTIEVDFDIPPYEERSGKNPATGFGDYPVLLIKNRFVSANAENGNYMLSGFLAFTAPTGSNAFSTKNFAIAPSIAGGKGWGNFDVMATFGIDFPTGDVHKLGTPLLTNVTFQYHVASQNYVLNLLWPEVEVNYTYWPNGPFRGKNQVFLLPGLNVGHIRLYGRVTLNLAVGYQFAVSDAHPQYENNWILSARINF